MSTRSAVRRITLVMFGGTALIALNGGAASATGSTTTPNSQSGTSPYAAHWTGKWSGTAPFDTYFFYGDGSPSTHYHGSATSRTYSHTFTTCTGENYTQELDVYDSGDRKAASQATTDVGKGLGC